MKVAALAGGVGGAKLADGLARVLVPEELTVIVNTGDDFEHLGLYICPDIDTVCYTLAGLANAETGWGRAGDTHQALDAVGVLGGDTWFQLGDKDLGTHIERTRRLQLGHPLSKIAADFSQVWGIHSKILPMTDQPVTTIVETLEYGELAFQEYFVLHRCAPRVRGFHFKGIESAQPAPGVLEALERADLVVLCPSNPWVSIDPILSVAGIRKALGPKSVIAVTPIIAGQTVKGPAAKMYAEMGIQPSALAVARHYQDILDAFVLDQADVNLANEFEIPVMVKNTLMKTIQDRQRLAREILEEIESR
jgi:LPPG:FO 2-phospho-L-lactate transferase